MRPNASGTTHASTSLTIGSLNDLKIFVMRSSAGSITCGAIRKRSKACFVPFFNYNVELFMRVYIGTTCSGSQLTEGLGPSRAQASALDYSELRNPCPSHQERDASRFGVCPFTRRPMTYS